MGRPCMRCGADMILGCAVRTADTFKLTDESSIYVQNGGMFTGRERPLYLAVCPDCGMAEPYVQDAKGLLPPKLEETPVEEEKPPKPEKEPWFRKKKDDPWE